MPVSPASVARVLLECAILVGPSSSTPNPDDARQLEERAEEMLQTIISHFQTQGRVVPPAVAEVARKAIHGRRLEAAQSTRRSSTQRSTSPRSEAAAVPPAPAPAPVVADDDQGDAEHARRRAAQAATMTDALRADLGALIEHHGWSGRRIGPAVGVSGRTVSHFVSCSTEGRPRWGDAARAWRDALPSAAPSQDLQRPLFISEGDAP